MRKPNQRASVIPRPVQEAKLSWIAKFNARLYRTGASNGPTEGLNLCVKKVKRAWRGFTCFEHYRQR